MIIFADHISKSYNEIPVLSDFSLRLPEHGIIGLSGPSGCGKTTFLHIMAGLIEPDSGSITGLAGKKTGVVFQEDRLLPWLTAQENIDLIVKNSTLTQQWLDAIQLSDKADSYPSELSGGMKRRLALARALAFDCDLLLMDEPFQGLDEMLKETLYPLVRDAALTKPVVMVSHDITELNNLANQLYQAAGTPMTVERIK